MEVKGYVEIMENREQYPKNGLSCHDKIQWLQAEVREKKKSWVINRMLIFNCEGN